MTLFFFSVDDVEYGPFGDDKVKRLWRCSKLKKDTQARVGGQDEWQSIEELADLMEVLEDVDAASDATVTTLGTPDDLDDNAPAYTGDNLDVPIIDEIEQPAGSIPRVSEGSRSPRASSQLLSDSAAEGAMQRPSIPEYSAMDSSQPSFKTERTRPMPDLTVAWQYGKEDSGVLLDDDQGVWMTVTTVRAGILLGEIVPEDFLKHDEHTSGTWYKVGLVDFFEDALEYVEMKKQNEYKNGPAVFTWGSGTSGQLGKGESEDDTEPAIIPALRGAKVMQVSCGTSHSAIVMDDGSLMSWGSGSKGKLGHDDTSQQLRPKAIEALSGSRVVGVSCGADFTACLTAAGEIFCWGDNTYGQLGTGDEVDSSVPTLVFAFGPSNRASVVSCGYGHTCVTTQSGELYTWGWGGFGQLGHGNRKDQNKAVRVKALDKNKVMGVSAGAEHTLVIDGTGKIFAFGHSQKGRLGVSVDANIVSTPVVVTALSGASVVKVSAGNDHSLALTSDGTLYAWGGNADGQLGLGHNDSVTTPEKVSIPGIVTAAVCGHSFSVCSLASQEIMVWGDGAVMYATMHGSLPGPTPNPVKVSSLTGKNVRSIAASAHIMVVSSGASSGSRPSSASANDRFQEVYEDMVADHESVKKDILICRNEMVEIMRENSGLEKKMASLNVSANLAVMTKLENDIAMREEMVQTLQEEVIHYRNENQRLEASLYGASTNLWKVQELKNELADIDKQEGIVVADVDALKGILHQKEVAIKTMTTTEFRIASIDRFKDEIKSHRRQLLDINYQLREDRRNIKSNDKKLKDERRMLADIREKYPDLEIPEPEEPTVPDDTISRTDTPATTVVPSRSVSRRSSKSQGSKAGTASVNGEVAVNDTIDEDADAEAERIAEEEAAQREAQMEAIAQKLIEMFEEVDAANAELVLKVAKLKKSVQKKEKRAAELEEEMGEMFKLMNTTGRELVGIRSQRLKVLRQVNEEYKRVMKESQRDVKKAEELAERARRKEWRDGIAKKLEKQAQAKKQRQREELERKRAAEEKRKKFVEEWTKMSKSVGKPSTGAASDKKKKRPKSGENSRKTAASIDRDSSASAPPVIVDGNEQMVARPFGDPTPTASQPGSKKASPKSSKPHTRENSTEQDHEGSPKSRKSTPKSASHSRKSSAAESTGKSQIPSAQGSKPVSVAGSSGGVRGEDAAGKSRSVTPKSSKAPSEKELEEGAAAAGDEDNDDDIDLNLDEVDEQNSVTLNDSIDLSDPAVATLLGDVSGLPKVKA